MFVGAATNGAASVHFGENVVTVGALEYSMINSAGAPRVFLALLLTSSMLATLAHRAGDGSQNTSNAGSRSTETTGRIRGRVFAADTGKPLAGAIVTVIDPRATGVLEGRVATA